jgi:hypothetical protein
MLEMIRRHASGIVLTCNIRDWERPETTLLPGQIHEEEFRYREYIQKLRIFDWTTLDETARAGISFDATQEPVLLHNVTTGAKVNSNYNTREEILAARGPLTFDGIYRNVYENRDLLEGKDVTLFVMGSYVGKDNAFDVGMPLERLCDWNEIMELVTDFGCKLGWHTWTHPDLTKVSPEVLKREVTPPFPMERFAYPYGRYNAAVIAAVRAAGFSDAWSVTQGNDTPFQRRRRYL